MSDELPFFCLPNLAATQIERRDPGAFEHPGFAFSDKRKFRSWCAQQSTDHLFLNFTEGLNPHLRVSKENPPQFLHGLIADYDAALSPGALEDALKRAKKNGVPSFASHTFSGGVRLL